MELGADNRYYYGVHPRKFYLWLAIGSMIMTFAAFTSAYIVKKSDINAWQTMPLPDLFWLSSGIILLSSGFMHLAYRSFKKNNLKTYRVMITITLLLGGLFMASQAFAWKEMFTEGVILKGNPSGAFLYVISGTHLAHALGGVVALIFFVVGAFRKYKTPVDTLIQNINMSSELKVELMATYWHFVDILWLYLFVFFLLNQ